MSNSNPALATSRSIHHWLLLAFVGVLLVGLGLSVWEGQWMNACLTAGIIFLTAVPSILGDRFHVDIPSEFRLLTTILLFGSLFLGEIHGYYTRYWWWDLVLHGGSGLLLGIFGFLLVYVLNEQANVHVHLETGFLSFFAFTFSLAMGSLWEIFEFVMDFYFGFNMQKSGIVDTMADMMVNTLGALLISTAGYFYLKSEKTYFLETWIAKFVERNPRLFSKKV